MKIKAILFGLFCFFTTATFAQIAKQNLIIEGGASLQLVNLSLENGNNGIISGTDATVFIGPSVSYFVSDRLAVGGSLLVNSIADAGTNFGLTGKARLYLSGDETGGWFLAGELGFLSGSRDGQFFGNGGLGFDIFLAPNLALESTMSVGFLNEEDIIGNLVQLRIGTGLKFFFDRFPEELPENRSEIIRKGTRFLGISSGSILLNRRNNVSTSLVNLSPSFGKFISNNMLFGWNFNLTNQSANGFNRFTVQATPFLRYYLNPTGKTLVPFGEVGGGISFNLLSGDVIPNQNQTETSPLLFANIGVDYFIRPNIAFEVKAGYRYAKISDAVIQNTTSLSLGFQFFLNRE